MADTANLGLSYMTTGQANKETKFNEALARIDVLCQSVVIDKDLTVPPTITDGACYIVPTGATLDWAADVGKLAFGFTEIGVWIFVTPKEGWIVWVADENRPYRHDGTNWLPAFGYDAYSAADTITASTTQTQVGATAITTQCARLTTVANVGDSVRIGQAAVVGAYQEFLNSGANAAWIWPATGDAIDAAAADARDANSLAAAGVRRYRCFTAGVWRTM